MPQLLTVNLSRPIRAVRIVGAAGGPCAGPARVQSRPEPAAGQIDSVGQAERNRLSTEVEQQKAQLAQLCQTVSNMADHLAELYRSTLTDNRTEIARLAVEIARKILLYKVSKADYDIQAIVEEALKRVPTRQNIAVHLNPEDLRQCQQCQQEHPGSPFAELEFIADWSVGRGECLVQTPKGIVKSFIEEHLEHISEALRKAEE